MKKHELLKYAYDNYPKGTKFTWGNGNDHISNNFFFFPFDSNAIFSEDKNGCQNTLFDGSKWAEIVKPKIAVKIEKEKEFKALMKYYKSIGISLGKNKGHTWSSWSGKPLCIQFHDKAETIYEEFAVGDIEFKDYKFIPFAEFAKEHGIKLPLLTSEDGVDLFEGNDYHEASWYEGGKVWQYVHGPSHKLKTNHRVYEYCEENKAFSTKRAALSWIEAQKLKEIEYTSQFGIKCQIYKEETLFTCDCGCFSITKKDFEKIIKTMNEL